MTASATFRDLAACSSRELEAVLRHGTAPSIDSVLGYEYRGFNHPPFTRLLGIRKFIKGFFEVRSRAFGFNTPARQTHLEEEWVARPDDANPRRYAFFGVDTAGVDPVHGPYADAVVLDYSKGRGHAVDPARRLRDYLVRVENDSDDLLLGKAYLVIGPTRIRVGFFLLERFRPFAAGPALQTQVRIADEPG